MAVDVCVGSSKSHECVAFAPYRFTKNTCQYRYSNLSVSRDDFSVQQKRKVCLLGRHVEIESLLISMINPSPIENLLQ